jgi:uncharacterized protein with PIN domain
MSMAQGGAMRGVQCELCGAVWLSQASAQLIEKNGGCLQCDGPLRELSEEETAAALEEQRDIPRSPVDRRAQ